MSERPSEEEGRDASNIKEYEKRLEKLSIYQQEKDKQKRGISYTRVGTEGYFKVLERQSDDQAAGSILLNMDALIVRKFISLNNLVSLSIVER